MFRPPLALVALLCSVAVSHAQVAYPARADKSDVSLRYRIASGRDERIVEYGKLRAYLENLGFAETPREDADLDQFDPTAETLSGSLPTDNLPKLFGFPAVQTAVARPAGVPLPADPVALVGVRIRLTGGLPPEPQHNLHAQASAHLGLLGFHEGVGYDTAGATILRGTIPAGNVMQLTKDLRTLPAGWFLPAVSRDLQPLPLRSTLPLRLVEVTGTPDPALIPPAPVPPPAIGAVLPSPKLSPGVQAYLADAANAAKPGRFELILDAEPGDAWPAFRERLRTSAEGTTIEGLVGLFVSVSIPKASDVTKLTDNLEVRFARLPRPASPTGVVASPAGLPGVGELAGQSRVRQVRELGYAGQGQHVVLVGTDFSGVHAAVGKTLPDGLQLIDLTAALHPDLIGETLGDAAGVGTVAAGVLHSIAPEAKLSMVRIDPAAFHQLFSVARIVSGQIAYSEAFRSRAEDLNRRVTALQARRIAVVNEYQRAFSNLSDEDREANRRTAARKAVDDLVADEQTLQGALGRFTRLKGQLDSLAGATVVVNTVVWNVGYPQDGLSELSRLIDTRFAAPPVRNALADLRRPPVPVWIQAAGANPAQAWAGTFLDADGDGVMEFAPESAATPAGRWTRELNFLKRTQAGGETTELLPSGMKLRLTVQWREPQDPGGYVPREPVFPMVLRLLRQIDPAGKSTASDDLVEVAHTEVRPIKLLRTYASGAFERTVEVTLPADGAYALRVEGQSAFDYQIAALKQQIEVSPRIVVENLGDATHGTPGFATFPGGPSGVGTPGDSLTAVTIGTLAGDTQRGTGPGVTLGTKPDLVAPGGVALGEMGLTGPAASAAFVGGSVAVLGSAGARGNDLTRYIGLHPGGDFVLPEAWVKSLQPRRVR